MGLDVQIYIQTTDGKIPELERSTGANFEIVEVKESWFPHEAIEGEDYPFGATHEIGSTCRYYGPGYARGDWGLICRVLMMLMACETVEKVWYGHDCEDHATMSECTVETIIEISRYYMQHGERPYRKR